jgi:hypothetical protein
VRRGRQRAGDVPAAVGFEIPSFRCPGKDYLPVGFLFHHGAFQAMDHTGRGRGLKEFAAGLPPAGTLEDTFERSG